MTTSKPAYIPQEIAYRDERGEWKRAAPKTQRAYDRLVAKLEERTAEWTCRDADGYFAP
jgi:hypothetical protein